MIYIIYVCVYIYIHNDVYLLYISIQFNSQYLHKFFTMYNTTQLQGVCNVYICTFPTSLSRKAADLNLGLFSVFRNFIRSADVRLAVVYILYV
jgi:hypothetical protein